MSVTSDLTSNVSSLSWVITMSLTVVLIAVSSIFSIKKLTARIALEVCLVIPFIFEIWWRHTAMEAFDAGSLAGHRSRHSLRKALPSVAL